jgi:hypothetical protein
MDWNTVELIADGQPPVTPYSHDRCMCQFAHELLRKGERVFIGVITEDPQEQSYKEVAQVYPEWRLVSSRNPFGSFTPKLVVGVHLAQLDIKDSFPDATVVMVNAALAFVEYPAFFEMRASGRQARRALQTSVDYVHVQNPRMKEIATNFYRVLASWNFPERILVHPFGIAREEKFELIARAQMRAEMGLAETDIAIINSGGIWKWTDFNTLLKAFVDVVREPNRQHLKFYIMGFRQPDNTDHADCIAETHAILDANKDLLGKNVYTFDDWSAVSKKIKSYTRAADVGVNVNKDSFENWQSYRVRFIEYMEAGLAVINTAGDYLSSHDAADAVYTVRAEKVEDCREALRRIADHPEEVKRKRAAMQALVPQFTSNHTTAALIDALLAGAPLSPEERPEITCDDMDAGRKLAFMLINVSEIVRFIEVFRNGRRLLTLLRKIKASFRKAPLASSQGVAPKAVIKRPAKPKRPAKIRFFKWL